jgi:uncharacterized protein (DUF927 family)
MTATIQTDMSASDAAKRLGGNSRRGGDSILVSCPVSVHGQGKGDRDPSLSLKNGDDGRLVYNCLAGCSSADVRDALISKGVLVPKDEYRPQSKQTLKRVTNIKPKKDAEKDTTKKEKPASDEWEPVPLDTPGAPEMTPEEVLLRARALELGPNGYLFVKHDRDYKVIGKFETTAIKNHVVCQKDGRPVVWDVRIEFGWQPDKRRPDKENRPISLWKNTKTGELKWKSKQWPPGQMQIFGQETLRPDHDVMVHEGPPKAEKAREVLPHLDHVAWCGGSGMARHHDWSCLADRVAIGAPDNDEPGRSAMVKIAELATKAGCTSFSVIEWPDHMPVTGGFDDCVGEHAVAVDFDAMISKATAHKTAERAPSQTGDSPFIVMDSGVFYRYTKDGEKIMDRICSRMDVIAVTHDEHGNGWGRVLRFKDLVGRLHEWAMPMSLAAGDGAEIRAELLDQGLNIEPFRQSGTRVIQYITSSAPSDTWLSVARPGWHGDFFIMPDETIGEGERRAVLQRERSFKHSFRAQGTLAEWQTNIGQYCVGNPYLAFTVSAAFAAPLLHIAHEQGGGFHIRGGSSCGKSTLLEVAGSVVGGGGQNGYLTSWRATDNGLEGVAETHCDSLLCLDEIGQANSKTIGQTAYMLANGQGKIRATKSGSARAPAEWRLLFLSSGEESLASKMNEAGSKTHAGMEIRLAEIPVKAHWGVLDNLHGFEGEEPAKDLINHLKKAAGQFYGHPIREYLRRLVKLDRLDLAKEIADVQTEFHKKYVPAGSGEQVGRVAKRFALVASGGELATDMGITGWEEGEATKAAGRCFKAWLEARGTSGNTEDISAIDQVRTFLEVHGAARFSHMNDKDEGVDDYLVINRAGYKRKNKDDETQTEYLVFRNVFRTEVCKGFDYQNVEELLISRGFLAVDKAGKRQITAKRAAGYLDENNQPVTTESGQMKTMERFYCILPSIFTGS